eukprot:2319666-Karenia_brevis.AAC.1
MRTERSRDEHQGGPGGVGQGASGSWCMLVDFNAFLQHVLVMNAYLSKGEKKFQQQKKKDGKKH